MAYERYTAVLGAAALQGAIGCGGRSLAMSDAGQGDASVDAATDGGSPAVDAGPAPACDGGWHCQVDSTCTTPTTLVGKVFDPAGLDPLDSAVVFVPADPQLLPAITRGSPTCALQPIGDYVAVAITDTTGTFTLTGVPTGKGVPVTVQVAKWGHQRRGRLRRRTRLDPRRVDRGRSGVAGEREGPHRLDRTTARRR